MTRYISLLCATFLCVVGAYSGELFSMSDRLMLAGRTVNAGVTNCSDSLLRVAPVEREVGVIVRFADDEALQRAVAGGLEIVERIGCCAIVTMSVKETMALARYDGIEGASLLRRKHPLCMEARTVSGVDRVQSGQQLSVSSMGDGVILGLYDIGLDPNHVNFLDTDGQSRVSRLWCYPLYPGWEDDADASVTPPEEFECVTYSTSEEIALFATDNQDETHGTHVLGIAAGSFINVRGNDYHGMAPASELVVACGRYDDLSILSGVRRIAEYASEAGKPCVINLSLGENAGPHDGTDEFTRCLNEIAAMPGITVCVAAGNEAQDGISIVKELTEKDNEIRSIIVGPRMTAASTGSFEVWSEDASPFELWLDVVDISRKSSPVIASFPIGDDVPTYLVSSDRDEYGQSEYYSDEVFSHHFIGSLVGGLKGMSESNGRFNAAVEIDLRPVNSLQTVFLSLRVVGSPGKRVYIYSPDTELVFTSKNLDGYIEPDGNGSINSIACGPHTISVGAYSPKVSYGYPFGTMAYFSSWSDMPDGSTLPDIVAPGVSVISSFSRYYVDSRRPLVKDEVEVDGELFQWGSKSGTSMSTPVMSGIAALWLSVSPDLSSDQIREIAMSTAAQPSDGHIRWGSGRVDAFEGMKKVLSLNEIGNVRDDSPTVLLRSDGFVYSILCSSASWIDVRITSMSGLQMMSAHVNDNSTSIDLSDFPSGVYLLTIITERGSHSFKLAR